MTAPRSPQPAQLADALAQFSAGHFAEAQRIAEQIVAADPNDARALHVVGAAAAQLGRTDEAIGRLRQATQMDPALADAWLDLARLLDAARRPDEALDALKHLARLRPDCDHLLGVADGLFKRRHFREAVDFYRQAIELRPDSADLRNRLSAALLETQDPTGAESAARAAIELDPRFARAHFNLGSVLRKTNRLEEALDAFRKALQIDPNFAQAYTNMAQLLAMLERMDEAEAAVRRAIELEPGRSTFWSNLAMVL